MWKQQRPTVNGPPGNPLDLTNLTALMELTSGTPELVVGLLDGPISVSHPDLASENIQGVPGGVRGACVQASSLACMHGTFVAGILSAKRNSSAPAICPNCTLLVRPIFAEVTSKNGHMPNATPSELADAIVACIDAGAHVVNISAAFAQPSVRGEYELERALDYAASRGVIIVAAAGNQGTLGSSVITRHSWTIPVAACDLNGRLTNQSNLGTSIGRRGLRAPGENVTSLGTNGKLLTTDGTSVAAPFVTGAIALLWSEFPRAAAADLKFVVTRTFASRRSTVVPPLLDAWAAYQALRR